MASGTGTADIDVLTLEARDETLTAEARLDSIHEILVRGRVRFALRLAEKLEASPDRDAVVALGKRILAGSKRFEEITTRRLATRTDGQGLRGEKCCGALLTSPGAHRIIFVFGGNAGWFHMEPAYIDRDDCHVMFLHDPSRCFCLCAIPGIGDDYRQNLATLRQVVEGLGATEVYCVGYSAGGYPALRYGLDLGARGVLSLAGPTTLDISEDPNLRVKDHPQLRPLYRNARHMAVDLVPLYRAAANPPRVLAIYGEGHARDAMLARRMASLPTVTLEALPNFQRHGVARELGRAGLLRSYVQRVVPPSGYVAAQAVDARSLSLTS